MKKYKAKTKLQKLIKVCVSDRYMYDEYKGYDVYTVGNSRLYKNRFLKMFGFNKFRRGEIAHSTEHTNTYTIYDIFAE